MRLQVVHHGASAIQTSDEIKETVREFFFSLIPSSTNGLQPKLLNSRRISSSFQELLEEYFQPCLSRDPQSVELNEDRYVWNVMNKVSHKWTMKSPGFARQVGFGGPLHSTLLWILTHVPGTDLLMNDIEI